MNIVLFEADEVHRPLARQDARAKHILSVLRREIGDTFDAGVINGPRGKAKVERIDNDNLILEFELNKTDPPLYPIELIVGLSRPQTNRRILREATSLGVRRLSFVQTDRSEPSYAVSRLWSSGEWKRHVLDGTAQAFATRIPEVFFGKALKDSITELAGDLERIALDNYESDVHLMDTRIEHPNFVLAVGSERGWSSDERNALRANGFKLAHLGPRPLRTEAAVVAGLSMIAGRIESGS
ncbi:MAG: RsmE family RNA methyltransferase [Verrucomicrobiota bacterium]|nr:RsmE family RNA methyltransferase [Verrucomicrobiota bacterium]